jgi:hypothetical protein
MIYKFVLLKKNLGLIWVMDLILGGSDLMRTEGVSCSNLVRLIKIQWSGCFFPTGRQ